MRWKSGHGPSHVAAQWWTGSATGPDGNLATAPRPPITVTAAARIQPDLTRGPDRNLATAPRPPTAVSPRWPRIRRDQPRDRRHAGHRETGEEPVRQRTVPPRSRRRPAPPESRPRRRSGAPSRTRDASCTGSLEPTGGSRGSCPGKAAAGTLPGLGGSTEGWPSLGGSGSAGSRDPRRTSRTPDAGRSLAALGLAHGARADARPTDRATTSHRYVPSPCPRAGQSTMEALHEVQQHDDDGPQHRGADLTRLRFRSATRRSHPGGHAAADIGEATALALVHEDREDHTGTLVDTRMTWSAMRSASTLLLPRPVTRHALTAGPPGADGAACAGHGARRPIESERMRYRARKPAIGANWRPWLAPPTRAPSDGRRRP